MENVENGENYNILSIIERVKVFCNYLKRKIFIIIVVTILSAALGVLYYYIQTPKYVASSTFILEEKTGASMNGIAGLASQFGFDFGGSINNSANFFGGDNILEILKSRLIVENVLLSKVRKEDSSVTSLADLYADFNGYRRSWQKNNRLSGLTFNNTNNKRDLTLLQDSILYSMYKAIVKNSLTVDRLNKKGSIFTVQVTSANQVFSKYMVERLVQESRSLYINIKTSTSQANIIRLEAKADSLLHLLNSNSYEAVKLQILDPNPAAKEASVPVELAQRNKALVAAIYTEVVRNLEAGKISLGQQTPVIQLLDTPYFPLEANKKGRLFLLIVGGTTGALLAIAFFGISFLFRSIIHKNK